MTSRRRDSPVAFRAGHARADRWEDAVEAALRQAAPIPRGGNLGFLYVSDRLAPAAAEIL